MYKELFERLPDESESSEKGGGFNPADLLALPDAQRGLMQQVIRRGPVSAGELSRELEVPAEAIEALFQSLTEKGLLARVSDTTPPRYQAVLRRKRSRRLPSSIWDNLSGKLENDG